MLVLACMLILGAQDIGLFEVNEAFSPQCIAVAKELGIDMSKSVPSSLVVNMLQLCHYCYDLLRSGST